MTDPRVKSQIYLNLSYSLERKLFYQYLMESLINFTVLPAKNDNDAMFCLQLLSKILPWTLHLS